jgi:hypothetical protein
LEQAEGFELEAKLVLLAVGEVRQRLGHCSGALSSRSASTAAKISKRADAKRPQVADLPTNVVQVIEQPLVTHFLLGHQGALLRDDANEVGAFATGRGRIFQSSVRRARKDISGGLFARV